MADLSDHDKRILLGPDYIEKERLEAAEKERRGGKEDPDDVRARWRTWRLGGGGIALIGAILFITHIVQNSVNYDLKLSILGAVVAVAGLAIGAYAHMALAKA